MPRLPEERQIALQGDISAGKLKPSQLLKKYKISYNTLKAYRIKFEDEADEITKQNLQKVQNGSLDTQGERKKDAQRIEDTILVPALQRLEAALADPSALPNPRDITLLLQAMSAKSAILDGFDRCHKLSITFRQGDNIVVNMDLSAIRDRIRDADLCHKCPCCVRLHASLAGDAHG